MRLVELEVSNYHHMERAYTSIQVRRSLPRQGWIKCNTNMALVPQNQQAGCGGVFRTTKELGWGVLLESLGAVQHLWQNSGAFY
jgi:hypothetical protein